ncbi:DUF3558 domain-containing protein [Nocardia sp. NPDC056064]|uniref:DUF3558 domain-containing protein n=1 Tax=Nocardia sp. NPDC056064 TaxID=3345701 RepID=UPI0035E245B4
MFVRRRSVVVASVMCGVLAVAGCSTTEEGKAQPSSTTDVAAATAALWDPCSEIPESTLTGLGLNPGSKRSGILGAEEPGWKICSWEDDSFPSNYGVGVYSTIYTIDDLRAKPENIDFQEMTIAGRNGVHYRQSHYESDEDCAFAFQTKTGLVQVDLLQTSSKRNRSAQPCDLLQPIADALVPLFPQ